MRKTKQLCFIALLCLSWVCSNLTEQEVNVVKKSNRRTKYHKCERSHSVDEGRHDAHACSWLLGHVGQVGQLVSDKIL